MSGPEMEKNLYHDEERMASVHLSDEDGISIEGVLGDTMRIKPMEGMERSADDHVPHTLYEVHYDEQGDHTDDYAVPRPNATGVTPESRLIFNTGLRLPVLIHPEVYVVVDYTICRAMKFKLKRIARYTAIMFNSANLRYRSMVQPRVQLTVVGITVTNSPSEEPYMVEVNGYTATRNILYGATIEKFKDYVALQSYFYSADVIWLLTGKNMSRWENKKLIGNSG
ncbi:hypothetical protein MTO96_040829, partial [Rhipicephalus appendiculatus]